jgi:hypothetical protein
MGLYPNRYPRHAAAPAPATAPQRAYMARLGVTPPTYCTKAEASRLIGAALDAKRPATPPNWRSAAARSVHGERYTAGNNPAADAEYARRQAATRAAMATTASYPDADELYEQYMEAEFERGFNEAHDRDLYDDMAADADLANDQAGYEAQNS